MPLDTRGIISAAQLGAYVPIAGVSLFLVIRYALRRDAGWLFLFIFSLSQHRVLFVLNFLKYICSTNRRWGLGCCGGADEKPKPRPLYRGLHHVLRWPGGFDACYDWLFGPCVRYIKCSLLVLSDPYVSEGSTRIVNTSTRPGCSYVNPVLSTVPR
jgi:hypothetical protein